LRGAVAASHDPRRRRSARLAAWAVRGELRLSGELGARERSAVEPVIDPSTMVVTLPPDHVWWWSVAGAATFYW
jgi:hypothetical protein